MSVVVATCPCGGTRGSLVSGGGLCVQRLKSFTAYHDHDGGCPFVVCRRSCSSNHAMHGAEHTVVGASARRYLVNALQEHYSRKVLFPSTDLFGSQRPCASEWPPYVRRTDGRRRLCGLLPGKPQTPCRLAWMVRKDATALNVGDLADRIGHVGQWRRGLCYRLPNCVGGRNG